MHARARMSLPFLALALAGCPAEPPPDPHVDGDGDGYTTFDGDCDDGDPKVNPAATELAYDGIDNDCSQGDLVDVDGDGILGTPAGGDDCDDTDGSIGSPQTWYADTDADGYGDDSTGVADCIPPSWTTTVTGDCDDEDPEVNPEGFEICNGKDDDCDGTTDGEAAADALPWFADADGDGFGDADQGTLACSQPEGHVADATDCDDTDPERHPQAWHPDVDEDGFGDAHTTTFSCDPPDETWMTDDGDCDDARPEAFPGADETCNGVDDDCDGQPDEDESIDALTWYLDSDGDGHGDLWAPHVSCAPPEAYVASSADCDDDEPLASPDLEEVCGDGIDNDCSDGPNDCGLYGEAPLSDALARFDGRNAGGALGSWAGVAGDVDGDGLDDLLLTARGDDAGGSSAGAAFLLSGPVSGAFDLTSAGGILEGSAAQHHLGHSAAAAGDVNGDGFDDLLLGAYGDDTAHSYGGSAWRVHGPVVGTSDVQDLGVHLLGESAYDYAGTHVSSADVNGDGNPDLLVAGPGDDDGGAGAGAVWVVLGPVTDDLDLSAADAKLEGPATGAAAGAGISPAGDVNGDGIVDLWVGATGDDEGGTGAGAVFLVLGPLDSDLSLNLADAKLVGEAAQDGVGSAISGGGDLNADGYADVLLGAPGHDDPSTNSGAAYVVLGPTLGTVPLGTADVRMLGDSATDEAGSAVVWLGDANGDGHSDLAVGAPSDDDGGTSAGAVHIVHGPLSGTLSLLDADGKLLGESAGDGAGSGVFFVGDLDGDGMDDLAVGAEGVDEAAADAGSLYLFLGGWY